MIQKASLLRMGYYAITTSESRLRLEKQSGNAIKFTGHSIPLMEPPRAVSNVSRRTGLPPERVAGIKVCGA